MHRPLTGWGSIAAIAMAATVITGCATVFKGDTSTFRIRGLTDTDTLRTPDGVEIPHEGGVVTVPAIDGPRVLIVKNELGERPVGLHRFVGVGWLLLDVFTGLVPVFVDAITGTWGEYKDLDLPRELVRPPQTEPARVKSSDPEEACRSLPDLEARIEKAEGRARELLQKIADRKRLECQGTQPSPR